jgi:hypothetical protein
MSIERCEACDRGIVVTAGLSPRVKTFNPAIPKPGALRDVTGIEMTLERVDHVFGHDLTATALSKSFVVDKFDAGLEPDGIGQAVIGDLR